MTAIRERPIGCHAFGLIKLLCVVCLVLIAGALFWFFAPQWLRLRGVQTPVSVTVRSSVVGAGSVVQVKNESEKSLQNVVVTAINPSTNQQSRYKIEALDAGETREIGGLEWSWDFKPGHRIEVDADGYLPIVFSSAQLGVK